MKNMYTTKKSDARRGAALVTVVCLSAVLMLAGLFMILMTNQAVTRARRLTQGAQVLAIAEAGIADMVAKLNTNYNMWSDATNTGNFGGGSFTVVSRTQSNNNVLVSSAGTLDGVTRVTVMELLGTFQDRNDELFSLDGVILSGGNVDFSTAAFAINGNVHANGSIASSSGAQNGDFTNTAVITANGTIGDLTATLQPGSPIREIPTNAFNFDSYRQLAISNGLYYSNSMTFANTNILPANGVVYVNGDATIENHSSLVGTLVVNGNITVQNNFAHTNFAPNMPALLSTGNVTLQNKEEYHGVIYAALNVSIQNNMTCHGGIISGGSTEIRNKVTMHQPNGYPLWDPMNPSVPPEVIVGGWLR